MKADLGFASLDPTEEIPALIESLLAAEQRLEELTAGEVDTVASRDGRTFLLLRAQEQVRHNEAAKQARILNELRVLVDLMPSMIWFKDTNNGFLRVNRRAAESAGMRVEDIEGKSAYEIFPQQAARYYAEDLAVIKSGSPQLGLVEEVRAPEGGLRWTQTDKVPVRASDGTVSGIIVMVHDITERRRADESVRQLAAIVESSADAIISKTVDGIITSWNPAAEKMFGFTAAEIVGQPMQRLIPWDHVEEEIEILAGFARGELVRHLETVRVRKDGTLFDVSATISAIKDVDGKIIGASKIVRDITERKRAEQALFQSEARLRFLNDLADAARPLADPEEIMAAMARLLGEHLHASRCAYADVENDGEQFSILHDYTDGCVSTVGNYRLSLFGPRAVAMLRSGQTLVIGNVEAELLPGEGADMFNAIGIKAIISCPLVKDGVLRAMMAVHQTKPREWKQGEIALVQEVVERCWATIERRTAQEKLRRSESLRRIAAQTARLGGWAVELPDIRVTWSDEVCAIHDVPTGTSPTIDEAIGFYALPSREAISRSFAACIQQGTPFDLELEVITAKGRRVSVRAIGEALRNSAGAITRVQGAFQDITERKQQEVELRTSEKRFKALFEQAAVGVALADVVTGRIVQINQRYCEMVGRSRPELESLTFDATAPSQSSDRERDSFLKLSTGVIREFTQQKRYVRKDRSEVWANLTVSAMWAPGETPDYFIAVAQDVTEHKLLEEQLRQAQKMEAIGQFCGGVAHDFNNILTVIQGYTGLMQLKGALPQHASDALEQISLASVRATALTRQLLTLSRKQVMQLRNLDLNEVVANMTKMLARILREDVRMELNYAPVPQVVYADVGMLEQVLMNLAVNARDAMPDGGTLRVKVEDITITPAMAESQAHSRPGSFVHLSVTDTGTGIAPDVLPKIFEPFFTTKEVGRGTGLGLATVYGIVKQHEGWIGVTSELGRGTTFHVYLPRRVATATVSARKAVSPAPAGGTETILLVEDEPGVRMLVEAILTRQGYRVLTAESGAAALAVWQHHHADIRLLLTDLVMPDGVSGMELARRLASEKPELRIIYTSGYSPETAGRNFPLRPGDNFLPKPFDTGRLAGTVRACLDGTSSNSPLSPAPT